MASIASRIRRLEKAQGREHPCPECAPGGSLALDQTRTVSGGEDPGVPEFCPTCGRRLIVTLELK